MHGKMNTAGGGVRRALSARNVTAGMAALFVGAVLFVALPPARARQSDQTAKNTKELTGNARHGKELFGKYGCYECHGWEGQGSAGTHGPRIGPPPIPLDALIRYVRHPLGMMPPYRAKVASDQDLADIYAYLRTIPKPPPAKDIPLLNE
jgi:mono/diheme cytochrome c family protein